MKKIVKLPDDSKAVVLFERGDTSGVVIITPTHLAGTYRTQETSTLTFLREERLLSEANDGLEAAIQRVREGRLEVPVKPVKKKRAASAGKKPKKTPLDKILNGFSTEKLIELKKILEEERERSKDDGSKNP